jgi:hypothetical protein
MRHSSKPLTSHFPCQSDMNRQVSITAQLQCDADMPAPRLGCSYGRQARHGKPQRPPQQLQWKGRGCAICHKPNCHACQEHSRFAVVAKHAAVGVRVHGVADAKALQHTTHSTCSFAQFRPVSHIQRGWPDADANNQAWL